MSAILELENVRAEYHGAISVLHGVSLQVDAGSTTSLLGANGAGKSSTLKAISGLLAAEQGVISDGVIRFLGENVTSVSAERIVGMGLFHVMEGRRIIADMTIVENLKLGAFTRRDQHNIKKDIDQVFEFFPRLKERKGMAGYLSGGEQQMLAIGRGLMAKPKLMLMDEPSMGLSPKLVKELFGIITSLKEELNLSILLVEQNATVALASSQQAYLMEHGEIVLHGESRVLAETDEIKDVYLGGHDEHAGVHKAYKEARRAALASSVV